MHISEASTLALFISHNLQHFISSNVQIILDI